MRGRSPRILYAAAQAPRWDGTDVWTGNKADVIGAGKLKSTDGVYGVRSAHNTEVNVTKLTLGKP